MDSEFTGIFLLLKGLPIKGKDKGRQATRKGLANIKFIVVGNVQGEEAIRLEAGMRESYPLDLEMTAEQLPAPLITPEGRLLYKLQVYCSTVEGRHVMVGEEIVRWMGRRAVGVEERKMEGIGLEMKVEGRRSLLGLMGRRKGCNVEWRVGRGGYRLGEVVRVELWGDTKEKEGLEVEGTVELVQKVWYQVPSGNGGKMWVKMKINGVGRKVGGGGVLGEAKEKIWEGGLRVPREVTPSFKWDFVNNVSYGLRFRVGIKGEVMDEPGYVQGELPLVLGSKVEGMEGEEGNEEEKGGGEEEEEDGEEEGGAGGNWRERQSPPGGEGEVGGDRRGSGCGGMGMMEGMPRSRSMSLMPTGMRRRANSTDSLNSFASSTLSMFWLPPSYSQLSSRRPTLETCN